MSPARICGGASTADLGFVDDVVVFQGRSVNHFHDCAEPDGAAPGIPEQLSREEQQRGPDALATPRAKVFADFGDCRDVRYGFVRELALDLGEVISQEVEDLFRLAGGLNGGWRDHALCSSPRSNLRTAAFIANGSS